MGGEASMNELLLFGAPLSLLFAVAFAVTFMLLWCLPAALGAGTRVVLLQDSASAALGLGSGLVVPFLLDRLSG